MQDLFINLVFTGHVDHGKSTLIGRILLDTGSVNPDRLEEVKNICTALGKDLELGYLMDNLQEEREQGVTIDTAQTFFTWKNREYIIIDSPGHVEFVRNMVTGASHADAAILIIDATEGVKEQTRRHAFILGLIGIREIIIVVNKMDLVGYSETRFLEVKNEISEVFAGINLKSRWIIPVSAKEGTGISKPFSEACSWFKGPVLLEILEELKGHLDLSDRSLRFVVQDVYNITKRITVGKVVQGKLASDASVLVLPTGQKTEVKSLECFGKTLLHADSGSAIGLTTTDKVFIERGYVLSEPDNPPFVTECFNARIFWMDKRLCHEGDDFIIRCSTQEVRGRIQVIKKVIDASNLTIYEDTGKISNLDIADVIIRTEKPVIIDTFDNTPEIGRFVLVKENPCAGGIILGDETCL